MKKIAIFASGSGSNAENIIYFFFKNPEICVKSVFSNVQDAYVLERSKKLDIPTYTFNREELNNPEKLFKELQKQEIDFIILAGFLWLIPTHIVEAYPNRIINIHPALLPAYGGKGMYGMKVHNAVIVAKEKESGITIHYVNGKYDEGDIIFQAKCDIEAGETAETLVEKIHALEHKHFPEIIKKVIEEA
ncbi:MAG: phosphoribosylglycinamide formyltransferase [Odoribacter sp.]|nr:phosphoribosylglycinamide formyltransferase [Odoribacter sp.]